MHFNKFRNLAFIAFIASLMSMSLAFGADLGAIKQQMKSRISAIDSMKSSGLVGITNKGYLAIKGSISAEQSKIVSAENKDRNVVYTALAKQVGASVDKVEKKRAMDLAKQSKKGVWLQNAQGQWFKK